MRSSIIRHTADIFDPDIFIVDKEPLGLRGEVRPDARPAAGARHAAGPRPARRDGRSRARSRPNGSARTRPGAAATITTRSGSTACRRSAIRWPASTCRRACGGAWSIPAICGATCRRTRPRPPQLRRSPDGEFLLVTAGRRRRRRGADRLGARAPTSTIPACCLPALIVFGPFMQPERAGGVRRARRAAAARCARDHLRRPARER